MDESKDPLRDLRQLAKSLQTIGLDATMEIVDDSMWDTLSPELFMCIADFQFHQRAANAMELLIKSSIVAHINNKDQELVGFDDYGECDDENCEGECEPD